MARSINNATINKKAIFDKISQVSIFSAYTNIPCNVINDCIEKGHLINSPFREDIHPSFGFRYDNKGKLKGRDFAGYFWGDCIDCVATVLSQIIQRPLNVSDKKDFMLILRHIAFTFSDVFYGNKKDDNFNESINVALNNIKQQKNLIEVATRSWNKDDKDYWNKFGISLNYLNTHFVYPVDQYYINKNTNPIPKYFYSKNPKDLCYAYFLGNDKKGISNIKLYFPNRTKGNEVRFITNANCLEGINLIEPIQYDYIVITKSTKDRLCLGAYLDSIPYGGTNFNIAVINIPHETYRITQNEYAWIRTKVNNSNRIISLMDNDKTGYREAIYLRDAYGITPILIPKEYECKDFSELRSKYSINFINSLFEEVLIYIEDNYEEIQPIWDKENYDSLPY